MNRHDEWLTTTPEDEADAAQRRELRRQVAEHSRQPREPGRRTEHFQVHDFIKGVHTTRWCKRVLHEEDFIA